MSKCKCKGVAYIPPSLSASVGFTLRYIKKYKDRFPYIDRDKYVAELVADAKSLERSKLDLIKLDEKLNTALINETEGTISKWLKDKRLNHRGGIIDTGNIW